MLPKSKRLKRDDFLKAHKRTTLRGNFFDVTVSPSSESRFACVVAKKRIRRAVDRNTVRRRVYSAVSHLVLKHPHSMIIYPKQNILGASYKNIEAELKAVFDTL